MGRSDHENCPGFRASKNTVRKLVRGDEISFSYERKTLHEAARPPIDYRDNLRRATQGVNIARRLTLKGTSKNSRFDRG